MAFRNYILLFALVVGTIASPINVQDGDTKCAKTCTASLSDSAKFQYTTGHTYTYTYEGTTETRLQGSSEQTTNLKIQAKADIEVISQCEFALKLREVQLKENDQVSTGSSEFKQRLEANPLRFAFQDGIIENVCTASGEDERVLNIKRGVLATFQNSMSQLDKNTLVSETDVSGTCPTTYTSKTGIFGGVTITKTKDILACNDRTGNISSIHSERYDVPSKFQNAPLLKSEHQCEQDVKSGKVQKTKCTETLMFRPFSKDGSGAVTTATQTLTYSTYQTSVSSTESAIQTRSSMLFHHVYDESIDVNAKSAVIALLQQICEEVAVDIKKSTPTLFGELVSKMKRLDSDKMLQVYRSVNGGRVCKSLRGKQFFFDALPMVASEASIALTKTLISEKIVQGAEAEMWLTQLAFIPRPTVEMLAAIQPLLNDPTYKSKALLGVSAMVHKICHATADCQRIQAVVDFVKILNDNIGSSCVGTTKSERDTIRLTLKAIGNAGDAVTSSSVIGRCITNANVDTETRVVALQAYKRMPCTVSREDAMRIYQNAEHDSELRIHAFLAVMTCPTTQVLTKVRMMLSGEPVNQVGSFVWTYLENIKETASPLKQELSTILDDAKLREDFNLDVRKFSRNLEKSFFSDYLNAGAQIESNLIWSQKSYIPRSAMLNVTVEMFGSSVNLVEFGGRVQGLEKIVEKFFGPNGYFSKENAKELMDNKRQTANYISSFDKVFKTPNDQITTSMYMKMFGNEIRFHEMDSSDWTELQGFNILDFLIKLAEPKKIDLTKNYQFIDSTLIVPTCVGLPMNLTVNGTASVSVDIDGNVDLRKIAASPRSFDINGHVKPSTAVIVAGSMSVDAIFAKSTMKMVATMHSSTQLVGKITLKDGQIFNIELNTPQKKMEIFHVRTEFMMNGKEMTMPEAAKTYKKCTPAGFTKVIGMEMCVDVTLPTFHQTGLPLPPFTGPMNAQIFIEKKDTHTGYTFTAKYENEKSEVSGETYTKRVVHASIDTPGSAVDRKLLVEGVFDPAQMIASAKVLSPWKKFEWSSALVNTMTLKKAQSTFTIDGTQAYSADAELAIQKKTVKTVYTPSLTITIPNKPAMSVSGSFETGTGKTVAAVDLSIKNFSRKPITLSSSLNQKKNGQSYDFAFDVKSDMITSSITSNLALSPGNYQGVATIQYSTLNRPTHRFSLSGKFADQSLGELKSYSLNSGLITTEFPDYNFNVDADLKATKSHVDTTVALQFNKEKLTLTHKTKKTGTLSALSLSSSTSFTYPTKNIDVKSQMTHEHNANMVKSSASVSYNGKTARHSVNLDKSITGKYSGDATLAYPGRDLSFNVNADQAMDGEYKILVGGKWANDANSQMSIASTWKSGETHKVTSEVKIPGYPVSVTVSVRPNPTNFKGEASVEYNKKTYTLRTEHSIDSTKLTGSGMWSCPHRVMSYEVALGSTNGRSTGSAEFSWESGKKVSMSTEYNNRDSNSAMSRHGTVTVTSPFGTQTYTSELERSTDFYRMTHELTVDDQRSIMSGKYSARKGEFNLDTPYIRYGQMKALNLEFNHDSNHVDATVAWAPTKKVSGEVKWSDVKYSAVFTTPFEMARFGGSVELPKIANPSINAFWNNKEASLTTTYPSADKGEFTLVYPGHKVSGSFTQAGDLKSFTGTAEFKYDEKKYYTNIKLSSTGPITLRIDVNTPLAIKQISANIMHQGNLMNFNNKASLIWDGKRIKTTASFTGKTAEISVKTPWRDVLSKYSVTGGAKSFVSNALLKWADDKEMTADMSFDITSDVKMSASIKSPFYDTVSGSLEHVGSKTNCNDKLVFTWAPTKSITATSSFSMTNGVKLSANFVAPEDVTGSMTVEHNGDLNSWTNKADFAYKNSSPMSVYSEFSKTRTSGKVGVKGVATEMFKQGEFSLTYTPAIASKMVVSSLTWNSNKAIHARTSLTTNNGYAVVASLTTPFTEDMSTEMSYTATQSAFNSKATVTWAPAKTITSTIALTRSDNSFDAKINADTPWRKLSFSANQQGKANEIVASTKMSWETGKEIVATLDFAKRAQTEVKVTLTTPFEMAKKVSATVQHKEARAGSFFNQLEAEYNGKNMNVATTWDVTSGYDLKVLTINPWKNFNTNINFVGTLEDFTAAADFTMDEKTYSTSARFSCSDKCVVSLNVNTVIYKPVSFSAELGKSSTVELTWGNNMKVKADAALKIDERLESMEMLISFATPFEGYRSGKATIMHTGSLRTSIRDSVKVNFNTQSAELTSSFAMAGEISGDVVMKSPWYNGDARFQHNGNMEQFSNSAEITYAAGKTITLSTKWNMANGIDSELIFKAPFKTIEVKYNHKLSSRNSVTAHAEMTMDSKKMFETDASFNKSPSMIQTEFSFTCPIKSFSGKYTHTGTMKTRCSATTEFTWDQTKTVSANWSINMVNGFSTEVDIKSPWKDISGEVKHIGSMERFENTVSVTYEAGKTISLATEFAMSPDFLVKSTLTSEWKNANFVYRHSGNLESFTCHLEGAYGNIPASADLKWRMISGFETSVDVKSPWKNFSGQISHTGTKERFENAVTVTYAAGKTITLNTEFSMRPSFLVKSTFASPMKNANFLYRHAGDFKNFDSHMEGAYGDMPASADFKWNMATGLDTSIDVKSQWKSFSGEINHTGNMKKFDNTMSVTYATGKTVSLKTEFTMSPTFYVKSTFTSPLKNANILYRHTGGLKNFECHMEGAYGEMPASTDFKWSTASGLTTSIDVKSPWKNFSGEIKHTGSMKRFDNTMSVTYATGKTITLKTEFTVSPTLSVKSTFTSPLKNANILYRHTGDFNSFTCHMEGAYDTVPASADLKWSMLSGYEASFDVKTPWKNSKGEFKTNTNVADLSSMAMFEWGAKRVETSLKFNTHSGTCLVTVKSPWRNMSADLSFNGELAGFETKCTVSWEEEKSITAEASYNSRVGMMKLSTPWRVMSANYRSQGPKENFSATVDFSWETGKKITLEARSDTTAGLDTEWKLMTPWRTLCTSLKFDSSYNMNTVISWGTGKEINAEITNSLTATTWKIETPWKNISGSFNRNGSLKKFTTTSSFTWESDKSITVAADFNMLDALTGSVAIRSPWKTMSAKFVQRGDLQKANGEYEVSWETGKKITTNVSFNRANGFDGSFSMVTPWRTVETNAKFEGELEKFVSSFDFTWEAGHKVTTTATYTHSPLVAKWSYKCPTKEMSAELKHTGSVKNFRNSAFFKWEPTKQIEVASAFNMESSVTGEATIKSPFSTDFKVDFEHTDTSGEITITNPYTENLKTAYTYKDYYNFDVTTTHGTTEYKSKVQTTWNNGMQTTFSASCPENTVSLDIDHQGDFKKFTNTVEAKWNSVTYKMTSSADVAAYTLSQVYETPITGYETLKWSASLTATKTSLSTKLMAGKNAAKVELDLSGDVEWKKFKSVFSTVIKVKTPVAGFEENELSGTFEYSQRLLRLKGDGSIGSVANKKSVDLYAKSTASGLNTYIKSDIYSEKQNEISFTYTYVTGKLVANYKCAVDFFPQSLNGEMNLDTTHTRTTSGMSHVGTLDITCHHVTRKITWSASSNANMCMTGHTHTVNGVEIINYAHKTTWNTDYSKMDHDMTFKTTKCSFMKDTQFKVTYDFTRPQASVAVTLFNDPSKPFDFKSETTVSEHGLMMMAELTTPFEAYKTCKTTVTLNKARPTYSVKIEHTVNGKTMTAQGSASGAESGVFDVSMSFTSQIPQYENFSMSVRNAKLQDQWKPHMVISWPGEKKIEMSGIVSWVNQYKASLDISTPFDKLKSLVTDITIDNKLPETFSSSFEFQTKQMSKKVAGQVNFDMTTKTFSLALQTPFESVESFEIKSSVRPRLAMTVKCNNENLFALAGNARFDSWKDHDLDVTVTYPFLNQFMRFKVNNDLSLATDNSMNSYVDFEYMTGQELSFKFDYKTGASNTISFVVETPFEKFEKSSYVVNYTGEPQSWTETTEATFYYGKVTTRTQFSMADGLTYHQTITGEMKNGWKSFNLQKDMVFTGDSSKFNIETSMSGSFVPTLKFATAWQYNPIVMSLKTTFNDYYVEYTHNGPVSDFRCDWKVQMPTERTWIGNWSFKNTDGYKLTADITCPHEDNFKFTFNANSMEGNFNGQAKIGEETVKYSANYKRAATPFKYEGYTMVETKNNKLVTSVALTENSIDFPISWNNKEVFAIRAKNPLNADEEYVPTIDMVIDGSEYKFDGLFKNVGSGLVRDFKLHMNGPRGNVEEAIKFQFEFRTQSAQLVPGDMKLSLTHVNAVKVETKFIDMDVAWGNDKAVINFVAPKPMRYTIDFSVSTTGQTATIEANWDTSAMNKSFKFVLSNKFASSSQRLTSEIDIDVIYMGVSRGFNSELTWLTNSFDQKMLFDYNGKQIGYDITLTGSGESSLEILTPWRNMKGTWSDMNGEMVAGFFWDSKNDLSKRFLGKCKWEETSANNYKMTTTLSHPALSKDFVIVDTIAYDTSRVYVSFNKHVSYSTDSTKDVTFDLILEKNGKWGVEIKQVFNHVHVRIGTEYTQTGTTSTILYKGANGRMRNFGLTTSANSVELRTPMKTVKVQASATGNAYNVAVTVDGKTYAGVVTVRPEDYYLSVRLNGASADIQLRAQKLDGGYKVELTKIEGSKSTIEGLAAISINASKTINGKLFWNPELVSELKGKIASLRSSLKDTVKSMSTAAKKETTKKASSMKLGNDFARIMPHSESEMELIKRDYTTAKVVVIGAYNDDVMYMKTNSKYVSGMLEEFAIVAAKIKTFFNEDVKPFLARVGATTDEVMLDLTNTLVKIETRIEELQAKVATQWNAQTKEIRAELSEVSAWLMTYVDSVSEYLAKHPVVNTLKSVHTTVMSKFNSASTTVINKVKAVTNAQAYTDAIYGAHSYVNSAILNSRFAKSVDFSAITGLSDTMHYKLKYYYNYYDVADNVNNFMTHASNVAKEYLNDYLTHYIDQAIDNFKWVAYDLTTGRIEFEFTMPTTLNKINVMQIKTDLKQRLNRVIAKLSNYRFDISELFSMYIPMSYEQILPPFDAQAIIAGQHIRTFDRRHYDFSSGKCSYILARDFNDGNFTVSVNYNGNEQSLTVHTNGKVIDIDEDSSIKMDGSKAELPLEFFNTTITRMGAKVILANTLGVKVICDNKYGLCSVEMSGHYFAKTGGLFGTYNYEPLDDFTTSTNVNTSDVTTFANSWASRCTGVNTAKTFSVVEGTKEYTACAAMFKDESSPLSQCFSTIKPDQAFHKCVTDMSKDVTSTATNGPCKAAMFYITQCKFAGVVMSEPTQCVSCQIDTTYLPVGETRQLTKPALTADVVFVVEEKMCNDNVDAKLPNLAKMIEASLSAYKDVKFGLVGFGGEHVHSPSHTHTMDSKMFAARSEFSLGTAALKFSPAGDNKDVFDAIDFAAQYPFRTGSTKVIIVIPCSDCSESKHSYRSVAERLTSQDITVHVINDFSYEVTTRGVNPSTNYLFGIDNAAVYALRDVRTLRGNTRLYPVVTKPTDSCSSLALQTEGTVFDLNMMTKMRSTTIKKFQSVFAKRVALTATPSKCTSCSCEYNELFKMSRTVCKKC